MPLLAMYVSLQVASPVIAVVALIISAYLMIVNRRELRINILISFLIPALLAVPVGIYLLKSLNESVLKMILGIVLVVFSSYKLIKPDLHFEFNKIITALFGFISGVLGGAYNTNGPPAIFYAASKFEDKNAFKANLQGMLLPVNIFIILGHYLSGLWTDEAISLFIDSLIPLSLGIILGSLISKYLKNTFFDKLVWIALIVIGVVLIV